MANKYGNGSMTERTPGNWQIRWWNNTLRKHQSETLRGVNKAEAQEILRQKLSKLYKGELVTTEKLKLNDVIDQYIADKKGNIADSTLESYEKLSKKHFHTAFEGMLLKKFKANDAYTFYIRLTRTLSVNSANGVFNLLKRIVEHCVSIDLIDKNPCNNIKLLKKTRPELQVLGADEITQLLTNLNSIKSHFKLPIIIGAETGMRRAEILGLTWDCINFDKKTITVKQQLVRAHKSDSMTAPKSDNSRREIPVTDYLMDILREHKLHQAKYLLKNGISNQMNLVNINAVGGNLSLAAFSHAFKTLLKSCGVEKELRLHDMRHSHLTIMSKILSPAELKNRGGHHSYQFTLEYYVQYDPKAETDGVERYSQLLHG